jgi:hypothetical protein
MTRVANHIRQRLAMCLAIAVCAVAVSLVFGTANAAAATYTFSTRSPYGAICNYAFLGTTNYKVINAYAPTVYARDAYSQYVYWRAVFWNTTTNQTIWTSAWSNPTVAYSTSPAQFTQFQQVTISGPAAFSAYAVETEVLWYSPTAGWHSAAIPVEAIHVAGSYDLVDATYQTSC